MVSGGDNAAVAWTFADGSDIPSLPLTEHFVKFLPSPSAADLRVAAWQMLVHT
jgi:hypothetical protein